MSEEADHLRISDADRQRVAEALRTAAGEGRLEIDELDERLEATWAARTYGDLLPITSDLPGENVPARADRAQAVPRQAGGQPVRGEKQLVAVMSGVRRTGTWYVGEQLGVTAIMGGADLDLREAVFAAPEVTINVVAVMGGCDIVVGPTTRVVVEGFGFMGAFDGPRGGGEPALGVEATETVVVKGVAVMGGVTVKRRDPRSDRSIRRHWQR